MRPLFALIGSEMNCFIDIQRQLEYYCQFLDKRKVEQLVRSPLQKSKKFFNVMQQQDGMPFGVSHSLCSAFPLYGDIAGKVFGSAPNAKILYTIGNPVSRYILHYVTENCPTNPQGIFDVEHIIQESSYMYMGLYHNQIMQYRNYFTQDSIHIVVVEDLLEDTETVFDGILEHIGLESGLPVVEDMNYDSTGILTALQNDIRYPGLVEMLSQYYNPTIELLSGYMSRDLFTLWGITQIG